MGKWGIGGLLMEEGREVGGGGVDCGRWCGKVCVWVCLLVRDGEE